CPSLFAFFFSSHCHHLDLHSFPTRRSSDLWATSFLHFQNLNLRLRLVLPQHGLAQALAINLLHERLDFLEAHFLAGLVIDGEDRSEEHTSELQSRGHLVCRLLLEKKKVKKS